jgi:RimJ/RimL family protein N-acetyltransferase
MMSAKIIAKNAKFVLRQTQDKDIEYLAKLLSNIELMRYTFGKAFEVNEAKEYIKKHFNFDNNLKFSPLCVDGQIVGFGGIFKFKDGYELGYILDKKFWNMGYATKFALLQRDYIKDTLKAKVYATAHPKNIASHRVLEKCGLTYVKDIVLEYRGERKLFELK